MTLRTTHLQMALQPLASPERAGPMRAYMKDQFPFLGIAAPVRRAAVAALLRTPLSHADLLATADDLWALPEREYRYTAVDLLARHASSLSVADVAHLLTLVQRDPWWDTVDALAGVVGDVLLANRLAQPGSDPQVLMDQALTHKSLWVRRVAMLHQLGWKEHTDTGRLFDYAVALAGEQEFFIRKAIGWALRDLARTQPAAVRSFIDTHCTRLSALTIREGSKHLL